MKRQTFSKINKFFLNFFHTMDYFSIQYSFRLNDQISYKSYFGGSIFTMYLLFAVVYFCVSFSQFWNRKNYNINYSIGANKNKEINLKNSQFAFAFSKIPEFLKDYTYLKVTYFANNKTRILNFTDCNMEKNFPNIQKRNKIDLSGMLCINLNKENIFVKGSEFDNATKDLEIQLMVNNRSRRDYKKFHSLFTFKKIARNPFKIIWFDNLINVGNPYESISKFLNYEKIYLESNKTKMISLSICTLEFSSDENIFYNGSNTQSLSYVDSIRKNSFYANKSIYAKEDLSLFKIALNYSPKMAIIDRKYKKLAEFLADFGGINSNLLLILCIFVKFLNEFWAEQKLMNKILKFREHLKVTNPNLINFLKEKLRIKDIDTQNSIDSIQTIQTNFMKSNFQNFKEDFDNVQENNKESCSPFSLEMTEKNEKISPLEINIETEQRIHEKIKNDNLKHIEKLFAEMKKPIFFNCYEVILRPCCKSTKLNLKNLLYQKALKKMNNSLDIINYVKKMQEIDILKYLLLDKDQVKIFNFLSLPSISMKFSDSDDYYMNVLKAPVFNAKFNTEELQEVFESYILIKNKKDELNNKLFSLFDNEVNHLLIDS